MGAGWVAGGGAGEGVGDGMMSVMISIFSRVILSKVSKLASVNKVRGGARVHIKVAGSQSLKVCVGARVYIEGARVYIKNQK